MSKWTPEFQSLVRKLDAYTKKQMLTLLDPNTSATKTSASLVFNHAVHGKTLFKKAVQHLGLPDDRTGWLTMLNQVVALADAHNSNAADNIKKALPMATGLTEEIKNIPSIADKVRYIKGKGLSF